MHIRENAQPMMEKQLDVFASDSLLHSSDPSGRISQVTSVLSESVLSVFVLQKQFNT